MRKTILVLLIGASILSGCTQKETEPADNMEQIIATEPAPEDTVSMDNSMLEPILISGIITEIDGDMITVEVAKGTAEEVVILKITDETQWSLPMDLMAVNQFITAEMSPLMTMSIPAQSDAVSIISFNDIVLGEVAEITDTQITLIPVDYYNNETIIINISEDTIWNVDAADVSAGSYIKVIVGMQMTMSIPPQVAGLEVLSIETGS